MMNHAEGGRKRLSNGNVFALGFAAPAAILLCAFYFIKVFPFGDNIILEVDSVHQYLPFLTELRRKLVSGESLFYSFSGGLGYNFWANLAYYSASPLNYLTVLIPEGSVCDFMVWLILIKISLIGGIFAWYLYHSEHCGAFSSVAFACMYSLANFFLGYKFNLMWLDSIAMVPLVMFGLETLVRERRSGVYMLSLFYALWCNYYIGYMICIFSCLYFLLLWFTEEGLTWKKRIKSAVRFALSSLTAGGMSAVLLLPAFCALMSTTSGMKGKMFTDLFYNNGISMLFSHFESSMAHRVNYDRGAVMLYCGVIVLLLMAFFFWNRAFSKKLRIGFGLLCAFFLLSFTFAPFNFVWHGFHLETGLPNRFAFLYLAVLIKLSAKSLSKLPALTWPRFFMAAVPVILLAAGYAVYAAATGEGLRAFITLGLLLAYAALSGILKSGAGAKGVFSCALCCILISETAGHSLYDMIKKGAYDKLFYTGYQRDFQSLIDDTGDQTFFRSELDSRSIENFITYAGGNGVALFDSTMQDNIGVFMSRMGVHQNLNKVTNYGLTKLMYDMMGVKYLATAHKSSDTMNGFTKIASKNNRHLYLNENALSLGFMVSENILNWDVESARGIDAQNSFIEHACGISDLYEKQLAFFARNDVRYLFNIPDGGMIYIKLSSSPEEVEWKTPEYTITYKSDTNVLMGAASTGEGQSLRMKLITKDGENANGTSYTSTKEKYESVISLLSESQLENVNERGNVVTGNISVENDGILLLTIPYNSGWSATVNGKEYPLTEVCKTFLGLRLEKGEYDIRLQFRPEGFDTGAKLSLAFALAACVILFLDRAGKRRRTS